MNVNKCCVVLCCEHSWFSDLNLQYGVFDGQVLILLLSLHNGMKSP
jgi:hypothetical protein